MFVFVIKFRLICLENVIQLHISEAFFVNTKGAKCVRYSQESELKRAYQLQQKVKVKKEI